MSETTTTTEAPGPGVYPGTAMDDYHRWAAASNSRLSRLLRSPAHLRAYLDEPQADTEALRVGRAIHAAVLEPDLFGSSFAGAPEGLDRRTKAGKEEWASLCDTFGEGNVLKAVEWDMCIRIRDNVHAHSAAHGMITGPGYAELSMLWEDADTGVLCKARWDRHSPDLAGGAIVDLKTTRDASSRSFEKSILTFGYHRQAAFYLMSAQARRLPARHFSIIAVEKAPPYAVAVYRITEGVVDAAAEQIQALLRLYADCVEHDRWPGYPDEVRDISIPAWAWNVMDEETADVEEVRVA